MNDVVRRYAQLQVLAENCRAYGRAVPAAVVQELHQLDAMARARLTPAQLQAAVHHVDVAKMQIRQEQGEARLRHSEQQAQQRIASALRGLTPGMAGRDRGLTLAELRDVAAGKQLPAAKRVTQEERDARIRDQTRKYDPAGQGWAEAEWARRLDELAEADPDRYQELAKGYSAPPEALRAAVGRWRNDRYEYSLARKREAADRERGHEGRPERAPNNDERRRAAVISAYMEHTAKDIEAGDTDAIDDFDGRICDAYRDEKAPDGSLTRRAIISRAFEHHEQESA
jgi:hypothetical protein